MTVDALLEVRGVSVAFGGLCALSDVNLRVHQGEVVGIIGPNGAGKTTLFNVISGLQPCQAGTVWFRGCDVSDLPPHRRARLGIGRSFQNLGLMPDATVRTNLNAARYVGSTYRSWDVYARPWRWRRGERKLRCSTEAILDKLGIAALADEKVGDVSFGIARFVELAAVLEERPALVLLDEPTTGLDVVEVKRLLELLRAVSAEGTTIVLIAHDVRFVMDLCDRVYVFAEGRQLSSGPPGEIQSDPAVVEAYLGAAP